MLRSNGWRAIHSVGGTSTGIFDRIDHLSIYSDDRQPLIDFFREQLGLQQFVPQTKYCFGDEDTPFALDMLHLGSGVGLEVYTDPDLKSWREYFGKKPGTVVNVGMQPTGFSLDRAQSLMLRQYVMRCIRRTSYASCTKLTTFVFYSAFKIAPAVLYHFSDEQCAADETLPRWCMKKMPFQVGIGAHMEEEGIKWSSRTQDLPQLTYFYCVQWHKDWLSHPAALRSRMTQAPQGPLGLLACKKVFWSLPWDESEMMRLGDQMRRFLASVRQASAQELAIQFPEGPELYVIAESDPQREQLMGRVNGFELSVTAPPTEVWTLLEEAGLAPRLQGAGGGDAAQQMAQATAQWGSSAAQAPRIVVDLEPVGGYGISLHFVGATVPQRRLAIAAQAYAEAHAELLAEGGGQGNPLLANAPPAAQLGPGVGVGGAGANALLAASGGGEGGVRAPGSMLHARDALATASTVAAAANPRNQVLPAGAVLAGAPSLAHAAASLQFAPPPALTLASRVASPESSTPGGAMGRVTRLNDRKGVMPADDAPKPKGLVQELFFWNRM